MKKKLFMVAALLMSQSLFALSEGATGRGAAFDEQMAARNSARQTPKGTGYGSPYANRQQSISDLDSAPEPRMMRGKMRGYGKSTVSSDPRIAALQRQIEDLKRQNRVLKKKCQQACADGGQQCPLPGENAAPQPTRRAWR